MLWTLLIVSMPTESTTARMRAWRALKACGAAVLRDGVYLVPATASTQASLASVGEDVLAHGGLAYQLALDSVAPYDFEPLFDRSTEFAAWILDVQACGAQLKPDNAPCNLGDWQEACRAFLGNKSVAQRFYDLKKVLLQKGYVSVDEQGRATRRME